MLQKACRPRPRLFTAGYLRVESVAVMFLKCHPRIKDGKEHRYWSVVENRRCGRAASLSSGKCSTLERLMTASAKAGAGRSKSSMRSGSGLCLWPCFPRIESCPTSPPVLACRSGYRSFPNYNILELFEQDFMIGLWRGSSGNSPAA
jgi:hypothetical protein